MVDSVEHRVECHRLATALRKQGKPVWANRIPLNDIFDEKEDPQSVMEKAHEVAKRLRAGLPAETLDIMSDDYDDEIEELVTDLESWTLENMNGNPVEMFNDRMSDIYDWADIKRVWLR